MSIIRSGYVQQDNIHECSELLNNNFQRMLPLSKKEVLKNKSQVANNKKKSTEQRKTEIISFSKELSNFGISFSTLTAKSPQDVQTKGSAIHLAQKVSDDIQLKYSLISQKQLPIEELAAWAGIPTGFIVKYQTYIIGISLLLMGNYEQLQSFLVGGIHK